MGRRGLRFLPQLLIFPWEAGWTVTVRDSGAVEGLGSGESWLSVAGGSRPWSVGARMGVRTGRTSVLGVHVDEGRSGSPITGLAWGQWDCHQSNEGMGEGKTG